MEEGVEAANLLADVREQQQHFVGLHKAREELRKGLGAPASLKLHAHRLQSDRLQLQRRVAQAQTNLTSIPDADAIKASTLIGHALMDADCGSRPPPGGGGGGGGAPCTCMPTGSSQIDCSCSAELLRPRPTLHPSLMLMLSRQVP